VYPSRGVRYLRYWGPLVVWLAAIFYFSTDAMSAPRTSRFLGPLLQWLLPGASPETIYVAHVAVRKGGHVAEYALLALLAFRAVRAESAARFRASWALSAFAIAVGFAFVDEYHQTFVSTRTGNLGDVAIDAAGAALALLALAWAFAERRG
jgi:VanZ family protein